jgi:diguanylate cyclase (GGDEF)-like protein/PAS domain S-box-containing protein
VLQTRMFRALPKGGLGDLGSPHAAGRFSAVLFFLCGLLVVAAGPLVHAPHVHHGLLAVLGGLTAVTGLVVMALPWHRWPRSATLWLVPCAFGLTGLHNWATGADGFRYGIFFLVVAAWLGLMHPRGTTLAATPLMVVAYVLPGVLVGNAGEVLYSLAYAVPAFILIGESASLVAEQVRNSETELRQNEERFRALVQNSSDAVMILAADATILWESPGITAVLGYDPSDRVGTNGMDYLHPDDVDIVVSVLAELLTEPGATRRLELTVRHKDGSWRQCEATGGNLLHEPAVAGLVVNLADVTERHRAQSIQRRLAAIVESTSDAVVAQSLDGTVLAWNGAAETSYGYRADEMIGRDIRCVVPEHLRSEMDEMLVRIGAGETVDRVTTKRLRRNGELVDVSLSMSPVRNAAGDVVSAACIARDITADVRAAQALANSEAGFRLLFSVNPQPMWVYEADTLRFLEVNDAAVRHYGYSRDAFLAMTIGDIRPPEELQRLITAAGVDADARHSAGWRHLLADGRIIEVEISSHRLPFAGRDAVLVGARDVTDRNALEGQLRHQAFHDNLTGLSNRALFSDRVEHALGRRGALPGPVVLLLDLDRFKLVNDSLGHAAGDELLIAVAQRLQGAVRSADTVARLGGDEFAVLLDLCSPARAEKHAARLLEAISAPLHLSGKHVDMTGSIGIAVAEPDMSAGEVLRNADMAMYRAKAAGGGCFRSFEPDMHTDALRDLEVNAALRSSLDDERFVLHYQPVVAAADGSVVAMEALVRWRRGDDLLSPAEFIPALEQSGQIVVLGEWILRRACSDASAWPANVQVNVNLSGRQLADPHLVQHVSQALTESGLDPDRLMLEITESVLMHNTDASIRQLAQLRDLGVGLAIDDFGTGYSSLAYLRAFPVAELKIDRSFIDTIADDPAAVPLVATIVQLARSLSLTTVAEGVETQAQCNLLRELGCDRLQGYFFARPAPVEQALMHLVEPEPISR